MELIIILAAIFVAPVLMGMFCARNEPEWVQVAGPSLP